MDSIDFFLGRELDNAIDIQVCLDRAFVLSDEIGFVGFKPVEAEAVFLGVNGDGAKAKLLGSAQKSSIRLYELVLTIGGKQAVKLKKLEIFRCYTKELMSN